jgi:hypothetical protein
MDDPLAAGRWVNGNNRKLLTCIRNLKMIIPSNSVVLILGIHSRKIIWKHRKWFM